MLLTVAVACALWQPVALAVVSKDYQLVVTGFTAVTFFLQIPTKYRADKRTRTADLEPHYK